MAGVSGSPVRILLVDDRRENLLALEAVLEPLGHELVMASSGEEALKRLLIDDIAVIVLDVMMPDMDGFETAEQIKQREKTRDIPIIFLTAISRDDSEVMRGYSAGAVDYVTKPFQGWLLRAKVEVFVELHRKNAILERQRALLTQRLDERYESEARQLRKLAEAALTINSTVSLGEMLERITVNAREIIGCRSADVRMAADGEPPPRPRGALSVPLTGRAGKVVGMIQLADKVEGDFTDNDETILVQLAQLASVAIENAELFQREHQIAATLQRSLLPQALPTLERVALAARYQPGGAGGQVGGDWYDALQLDDGRVGLTVGDVAGRGAQAAAVMGQLRIAMRAYAMQGLPPAEVMAGVDRVLQDLSNAYLATAAYLVLDPAAGELRYVNAGHPPPLVVATDGTACYLPGASSPPLGTLPDSRYHEVRVSLQPGSVVVLYTDGLVEDRASVLDEGLAALRAAAEGPTDDLDALCERVLDRMDAAQRVDDIALLAARLLP